MALLCDSCKSRQTTIRTVQALPDCHSFLIQPNIHGSIILRSSSSSLPVTIFSMSPTYSVFLAILTILMLTMVNETAAKCISTKAKGRMMRNMHQRARKIRMPKPVFQCFVKYLIEVPPVIKSTVHGKKYCYEESTLRSYFQSAIQSCIFSRPSGRNIRKASVRALLPALTCPGLDGGIISCPVSTYYVTSCSCHSGCHFCCLVGSIGASSWCGRLYCPHGGRCS